MKLGLPHCTRTLAALGACLLSAAACRDDKPSAHVPSQEPRSQSPQQGRTSAIDAAPASVPGQQSSIAIDAGSPPPDGVCTVLAKVPTGGRFGDRPPKKKVPKHAGIRKLTLRADPSGALELAVLSEDDTENDLRLSVGALSPGRALQVFRYRDQEWEDLGRPFQLIGWGMTLDAVSSDGPSAYAVSTGIGDVRRALVAACNGGVWGHKARYTGKNFEAAALVTDPKNGAIDNVEIIPGLFGELGADCKPAAHFGGGKIPISVKLPASLAEDASQVTIAFAAPGECRLPRKFIASKSRESLLVGYEQCESIDGGDYIQTAACQLSTLWFTEGKWQRLPPFEKLGSYASDERAALAIGESGPLVAVTRAKGLSVHQHGPQGWRALPKLPGGACRLPVALRADPVRLITRSCGPYGPAKAYRLEGETWRALGGAFALKPKFGAQQRPALSGDWLGETPYLAVGYHGAPVARVLAAKGSKWKQVLETVVDPKRPTKSGN